MMCIICKEKTDKPIRAAIWHFRPLDLEQTRWFYGTVRSFGIVAGMTLISPLLNTLVYWRYRKARLTSQFCALEDVGNE